MRHFIGMMVICFFSLNAGEEITVKMSTEKIGESVHWAPQEVKVKPGQKIKFEVSHKLEGGFDYHGFVIPELDVTETIYRNKKVTISKVVPDTLKPGEYKIGCQFHPKHVAAKLVVGP